MTELDLMVEQSRKVYNRLQLLQQQFERSTDPYREPAFRVDVLMAFSHTFDLAYDLNRYWSKLAEVPVEPETPSLHGGECVSCGRYCTILDQSGECEGCVLEAMIQARAW